LRRVLPPSHYFPGKLSKASNYPVSGGTADVWRVTDDKMQIFAAKVFRATEAEEYKIKAGSSLVKSGQMIYTLSRGIIRKLRCGSG